MRIKQFDVVELKDKNKAIILKIYKGKKYCAEIVNDKGKTIDKKKIVNNQIDRVLYTKK